MNIFFFGSTSFAAHVLIKNLKKKYKVYSFSRSDSKNNYFFDLNKINNEIFKKIKIKKIDYLFFFSSFVPHKENISEWKNCKKTNVIGLVDLLMKIKIPVKKIILASSCSVYGEQNKKNSEKNFLKPNNGYAITKFAQEKILDIYCKQNKIKFLCYRLGYVFGKNMNNKRLVKRIILKIKNNIKIKIYNENLNLNLIHQNDISNLISCTFKRAEGIYNITHPYRTSLRYFCNTALGKTNKKNTKNNYSPEKIFRNFPLINKPNMKKNIINFLNEN
tara:strand:+ start:1860 stop:2684 length:825 start_codon:yes stop_codon:yes gene_type:complete